MSKLPDRKRMNQLAELYRRLSEDLAQKPMPTDGSLPPDGDRPAVWHLHQKVRAYVGLQESGNDPQPAHDDIVAFLRGFMRDPQFQFDAPEIAALSRLMTDSQNAPLAPYSPYSAESVHAAAW